MKKTTTTAKSYTLAEIKAANNAAGRYFFTKGAQRFFNSKILPTIYQGAGGIYFVTGERMELTHALKYTVRTFDPTTGEVDTAGDFCRHDLETARDNAKQHARHGLTK